MSIFKKTKKDNEAVISDQKSVKKTEEKKFASKKETTNKTPVSAGARDLTWVFKRQRITEKSAISAEKKVYVFEVAPEATKKDIAQAVKEFYKVTPKKICIAKVPSKKVTRRKRSGTTTGFKSGKKKAYIYLNKKDSIDFV